jgi:hypothetical protein
MSGHDYEDKSASGAEHVDHPPHDVADPVMKMALQAALSSIMFGLAGVAGRPEEGRAAKTEEGVANLTDAFAKRGFSGVEAGIRSVCCLIDDVQLYVCRDALEWAEAEEARRLTAA